MREDQRFEIDRALDLLPHVIGGSWAMVWFRMKGIRNPTKEEFRDKVIEFFSKIEPLLKSFDNDELLDDVKARMSGLLDPIIKEEIVGTAEVLEVFNSLLIRSRPLIKICFFIF